MACRDKEKDFTDVIINFAYDRTKRSARQDPRRAWVVIPRQSVRVAMHVGKPMRACIRCAASVAHLGSSLGDGCH